MQDVALNNQLENMFATVFAESIQCLSLDMSNISTARETNPLEVFFW